MKGVTYKVTAVSDKAFKGNKKLTTVTIGSNVAKIGKEAFSSCKNLKKITVTAGKLKTIGKNAFKGINKKATIKTDKDKLTKLEEQLKEEQQELQQANEAKVQLSYPTSTPTKPTTD